ncbi:hypothetical protein PspLS_02860 [Pyricularia sp. CBS 133598]|nr:hypothetical protein PspLS_02860 [Pyricularia sp. CBS 133598]
MPPMRLNHLLALILGVGVACTLAGTAPAIAASLSLEDLDEKLQQCDIVKEMSAEKAAHFAQSSTSSMSALLDMLFPGGPAVNAILATFYISGPPTFLLALCPKNIDPSSLSTMVAFAVGGLMGDTLFHLLPEIFLGEDEPDHARFVLVEPNRNLLLGVGILVGFMTFVAMDKGLRIATGGAGGHDHSHGHSHGAHKHDATAEVVSATSVDTGKGARSRKGAGAEAAAANGSKEVATVKEPAQQVNSSGLLNLIADFTHNITDGLAMSASFYASPTIGATTALAVALHECPHQVGDFALLIQSGFSKWSAIGLQFVTALGALLGTLIGIAVQEFGGSGGEPVLMGAGLWGTSLTWGDMLLPFTAGTFLYVGTVAAVPELLETESGDKVREVKKTFVQFVAVALGAGIMLYISWH